MLPKGSACGTPTPHKHPTAPASVAAVAHGDTSAAALHPVSLLEAHGESGVDVDEGVVVEAASIGLVGAAAAAAADAGGALARARRGDPRTSGWDADAFLGATSSTGEVGSVRD